MNEYLRRLGASPMRGAELAAASLAVALFSLASPLFVIEVLNRYIAAGTDQTLVTLCTGMLLSIVLLHLFRLWRLRAAQETFTAPDQELAAKVLAQVAHVKAGALGGEGGRLAAQALDRLQAVQAGYEPSQCLRMLDAPFSLLLLGAAMLLSLKLGLAGAAGMAATFLAARWSLARAAQGVDAVREVQARQNALALSAARHPETMAAFGGLELIETRGRADAFQCAHLRATQVVRRSVSQAVTQVAVLMTSVALYGLGALEVVRGDLSVGALIGVNILALMGCRSMTGLATAWSALAAAGTARQDLDRFLALPVEGERGAMLTSYAGGLTLRDVGYSHAGASSPVFESLTVFLRPGTVAVACGPSGAGKTTLARLVAGFLEPVRGDILADGLNLRQASAAWWRRSVAYLPQEPWLVDASLRENIAAQAPDLDEQALARAVNQAGLGGFVFSLDQGLEWLVERQGRDLPLRLRRKIGLARILAQIAAQDARLVVLDEPLEGLDQPGVEAMAAAMQGWSGQGRTLLIMTNAPERFTGAQVVIDLGAAGTPQVHEQAAQARQPSSPGENRQ